MHKYRLELSSQTKNHIYLFLLMVGLFVSVETLGPIFQSCERGFDINHPLNAVPCAMFNAAVIILILSCMHRFVFSGMIVFTLIYGCLCYANLMHYRGLDSYLPFQMMTETQQLEGLGSSIFGLVRWYDVFYLVLPAVILFYFFRIKKNFTEFRFVRHLAIVGAFILVMSVPYFFAHKSIGATMQRFRGQVIERCHLQPIDTYQTLGLVPIIYFQAYMASNSDAYDMITDEEMSQIKGLIQENVEANNLCDTSVVTPKKNVVVMLMESLNTACISPSVMPTLDSLSNLSTSLYCPKTNQLSQGAMSIGGQFVVLSGLHGLMSAPFSSLCPYNVYPSIAKDLKARYDDLSSFTVVSTDKYYWRQNEVSDALGFENLYGVKDGITLFNRNKWADDKAVFQKTLDIIPDDGRAFCALIVPSNMHSNYDPDWTLDYEVAFEGVSDPKCHEYFRRARYLDDQIAHFVNELKSRGLYEETMIVVTSDHQVPWNYCSEEMCSTLSAYFPSVFINAGGCWDENNQRNKDVVFCHSQIYPTMLQLMGLKPDEYAGLFPPMTNVEASVEYAFDKCAYNETENDRLKQIYHLQEKMIRSGYFGRIGN